MLNLRILFVLCFLGAALSLEYPLWQQGLVFAASLLIFLFIDFYVMRKIGFYKVLTMGLTSILFLGSLYFVFSLMGIQAKINLDTSLANVFIINGVLLVIFFSLRIGATAIYFKKKTESSTPQENICVLDTSTIIDGRVIDLSEAGFLFYNMIVPEFVVQELQLISDSSNHEKRKKGRRGLEMLKRMKNSERVSITFLPVDYDFLKGVDNKLLHFAKEHKAHLITTDYNLIKVAEVQNISVININKIATILKPAYSVGERLKVNIIKKGNSKRQGVAYLEDDTMVVVEEGERYIGQTRSIVVTSFVQSSSGKMLFCKLA